MKKRKTNRKVNIFKYLSILLIILFILAIPFLVKKIIKINRIECQSQFGICDEDIVNNLQIFGNYEHSKNTIEQRLKQNVQIESYLIQYKIPSIIKIEINLKKAKFAIRNELGNYYLIDKNGVVLKVTNESNLPTVNRNDASYKSGEKITDKDRFSLNLIEKIGLISSISSVEVIDTVLNLKLNEGVLVKFPLEGDVDVLVGSLRIIFSRLNEGTQGIRMEDVHEIDLRFKNPVLR